MSKNKFALLDGLLLQMIVYTWLYILWLYIRMLIFNSKNLTVTQKNKLQKIVSYIVGVYVPSFLMIHLNPKAPEGPFLLYFTAICLAVLLKSTQISLMLL